MKYDRYGRQRIGWMCERVGCMWLVFAVGMTLVLASPSDPAASPVGTDAASNPSWIETGAKGPASEFLSVLLCQFQLIDTLKFSADICVLVMRNDESGQPPRAGEVACGTIRFFGSDIRYRYTSSIAPAAYPGLQTDVAYDGREFQLLLSDGTLIRSADHTDTLLPTLPNPIFELLQFRYPLSDDQAAHELRWTFLRGDPVPNDLRMTVWSQVNENGELRFRSIVPGGVLDRRVYEHHIYYDGSTPPAFLRIERVSSEGTLTRAEFSNFLATDLCGHSSWWPQDIRLMAYDANQDPVVIVDCHVYDLVVNGHLPAETFRIPPAGARRVYDQPAPVDGPR